MHKSTLKKSILLVLRVFVLCLVFSSYGQNITWQKIDYHDSTSKNAEFTVQQFYKLEALSHHLFITIEKWFHVNNQIFDNRKATYRFNFYRISNFFN